MQQIFAKQIHNDKSVQYKSALSIKHHIVSDGATWISHGSIFRIDKN